MQESPQPSGGKFNAMLQWLSDNGGYYHGVQVPVKFPGGQVGIAASQDLQARSAIICVPSKCILSVRKSLESELKPIFLKYEHMFSLEKVSDAQFNVLALYLFYELLKKEKSFYHPYFQCLPHGEFTMIDWTPESVEACHSTFLKGQSSYVGEELLRIYQEIKAQIIDTEDLFRQLSCSDDELKSTFLRAYNIVMTRCYGWSLPSTCLIPLADMCNHNDVQNTTHFIVHRQYEINPETKPPEYIIKKEHLDLSLMGIQPPAEKPTKITHKYKFVRKYIERKHRNEIVVEPDTDPAVLTEMIKAIEMEQLSSAKSFSELALYHTSDEQDNDTDQEEKQKKNNIMTDLRCKEIQLNINKKRRNMKENHTKEEDEGFEMNPHEHEQDVIVHQQMKEEDSEKSESLEQADWNWLEEKDEQWYFVVTTEGPIKKGEQVYNNYGQRTNRFLMMWYGFCPTVNKYDSYSFRVELDSAQKWPLHELPEHMIFGGWMEQQLRGKEELTQQLRSKNLSKEFRLKHTTLCLDFVRFLRMWLLRLHKNFDQIRCFQIPTSIDYEIYVFQFYLLVLVHILDKEFNEKLKPSSPPANHFEFFANSFRTSQQRIVHEQRNLVRECLNILVNLKKGAKLADFIRLVPLDNLHRIIHYITELEQNL